MEMNIKNMVCPRCVESVNQITEELHLPADSVELGSVSFSRKLEEQEVNQFDELLKNKGFELIVDRETELVNKVKTLLLSYVTHLEEDKNPRKLSAFISDHLHHNYSYLSHVFSEVEGKTVETHLIELKIERVKELLSYNKWTLSEIAWKLKYSSVQYLSNQFKKVTGKTVTEYRAGKSSRRSLDQI